MIVTERNLHRFFETFELPEDIHERLNVIVLLAGFFKELEHQLTETIQSEFQSSREGK